MKIMQQSVEMVTEDDFYKKIERCGRVCYKSEDKITKDSAKKFCEMLLQRGHLSVFEHWRERFSGRSARAMLEDDEFTLEELARRTPSTVYPTLHLVSSIQVLRQLFRHRKLSISQESTRYCRYKDGIAVIAPAFKPDSQQYSVWENSILQQEQSYLQLLSEGAKPEDAASILPLCTKSEAMVTAHLIDWIYIIGIRTQKDVFHQTRELARMIKAILEKEK